VGKVFKLSESELVSLIEKVLNEQSEEKNELNNCLKSEFNLTSSIGLDHCVKMSEGDLSENTLLECGKSIAKKLNKSENEAIDKLESLTNCLTKNANLQEQTTTTSGASTTTTGSTDLRQVDIKNNLCSVKDGVITIEGSNKNKKWQDYICDIDIQPNELSPILVDCLDGEVAQYFVKFKDSKSMLEELKRLKAAKIPLGKTTQELEKEYFKTLPSSLNKKTVQFYNEDGDPSFIGYIHKVQKGEPGKIQIVVNKYDTKTKKILDWGEGYVLDPKKPRIFEWSCSDKYGEFIVISDSRGLTKNEIYIQNNKLDDLMEDYCNAFNKERNREVTPDFSKINTTNQNSLTEQTTDDVEEKEGLNVFNGKTVKFYDQKGKVVGYGRIEIIEKYKDENNNDIPTKLKIKVTNIDSNGNDIPKGRNITNQKILTFDCNSNNIKIYLDENNREQSGNIIYSNPTLVRAIHQGYCKNIKKFRADYIALRQKR
jgi:hypothetical protein